MDETYKVAITRLGDRIRVGGTAEISGYDLTPARIAPRARWNIRSATCFRTAATLTQATLLVRAAADDAGRPADHRRHQVLQPLSQHRPRHARLDHGLRLGTGAGRHHFGDASRTSTWASSAFSDTAERRRRGGGYPAARSALDRHRVVQRQPAAIGIDGLAGDVARLVGRQEGGDRGDLGRLADAAERRARQDAVARRRIAFTLASISVLIEPGPMALTRMPQGARPAP